MDGDIFTPIYLIPQSISGIGAKTYPEERYQLNCCSTCEVLKINGLPAVFVFKGIYREGKHPDDFLEVVLSYIKDISGNLIDGCFRLTDAECFDEYEELPWENIFFETECVSTCQECVPNPEPAPFITNHKIIYPDFKVNNVDPYKAEQIFCEFGNAFYEKALALKFGVQFCCPTDLMQSTIEHEILKMEIVEDKYACCKDKNPCANCSPIQTHLPDLPPCTPSNGPWSYTYGPWSSWSTCIDQSQTRSRLATGTRQCILPYCNTYTEISKSTETETQACLCPTSCDEWVYTYSNWSNWSVCDGTNKFRTRNVNGTRNCILTNCTTTIETSISVETENEACIICLDCIAHDVPLIGTQEWTGCNATKVTYNNGNSIPYEPDPVAWAALTTGAWCHVDGDPANEAQFGKLYNWYAINDPRGFAPIGYHVPTDAEWATLVNNTGGYSNAGTDLKALTPPPCFWLSGGGFGTNAFGFDARGPGVRFSDGSYSGIRSYCYLWSVTEINASTVWTHNITWGPNVSRLPLNKQLGASVRFIKDDPCPNCIAHDVTIGTQTWSGCNLNVIKFRNNDPIDYEPDPVAWASLTTPAWCYVNGDPSTEATYGRLYNWHAVNSTRGLAPIGYHIPSDAEWTILTDYLISISVPTGSSLKEVGTCHWGAPNLDTTDITGFTALPGGRRFNNGGIYINMNDAAFWWSSSQFDIDKAWHRTIDNGVVNIYRGDADKNDGMSVRFIKD
jgi:uncharacterized protein (TIGR02145 family)